MRDLILATVAWVMSGIWGTAYLTAQTQPLLSQTRLAENDAQLAQYFETQTRQIAGLRLPPDLQLAQWEALRETWRRELLEMLGLMPWPERTSLDAKVTGRMADDEVIVENVHFQSRPGLYVTGNLYRPRATEGGDAAPREKLPAILYVCGHGRVVKDGVSLGSKAHYQHHGAWFARNGYVCLTIDTLQLGEIEGIHHGTYRYDRWWWLNRGYTPAGVEAWNCVRALDYLQSRPEVDPQRLGVTGRSGGGAYSWWIAAIDERIKAAVPVAGITDLENHVVDGCVEGHCDCMYFVNTYRWDYARLAALVAPRPLLISNTDRDRIFPLDGVVRIYNEVASLYELYQKREQVALQITAGPHQDTQELRVHAFRWFNHYLKQSDDLIRDVADKRYEPVDLQVFEKLPADETNTRIDESFVAQAKSPAVTSNPEQWTSTRNDWLRQLSLRTFAAWPDANKLAKVQRSKAVEHDGLRVRTVEFESQQHVPLTLVILSGANHAQPELTVLNVVDQAGWQAFVQSLPLELRATLPWSDAETAFAAEDYKSLKGMLEKFPWAMAYLAPRGIGPHAWNPDPKKQVQIRRRFYLLGQSLDGMRAWDVRRAIQLLRAEQPYSKTRLWLQAEKQMGLIALYASLFEDGIERLDLHQLPRSHRDGPYLLNVSRLLGVPQAVALAAERTRVVLYDPEGDASAWQYPIQLANQLQWDEKAITLRASTDDN